MNTLDSIKQSLSADLERLDTVIHDNLKTDNQLLQNVVLHQLRTKGKQIRPIFVMLCARLFGEINEKTLASAASVELLHNASLIHDDVVDATTQRRGLPTINAIWDNHIAVLVGDFFVSTSMQQAISTGDVRVIDSLCHLGKLLSLGELDQIYNARYHTLTEEAYYQIITHKTASLFIACARMACYSCGVDDQRLEALVEFARLIGLCFQIRDDIFDYFPDKGVGKPTGNDLREGKITLPLLHVLLNKDLAKHDEMLALSQKDGLDGEDIERLIAYAVENGGIEYARQQMFDMRDRADEILKIFEDSDARRQLIELFDFIIDRKS